MKTTYVAMIVALLLAVASVSVAQNYKIESYSINSGGGSVISENFKLSGTIGQPIAGFTENINFKHWIGFWAWEMPFPIGYKLSSTVHLGNYSGQIEGIPVTIDLLTEDGLTVLRTENTTLDSESKFYLYDVEPGTYKVGIKPSHWLRRVTGPVTVTDADLDFVIQ